MPNKSGDGINRTNEREREREGGREEERERKRDSIIIRMQEEKQLN